ncbi:MAG: 1-acyl-sn-glycerol-3-phosphate acyltransferase [Bacteroidia bacterium]
MDSQVAKPTSKFIDIKRVIADKSPRLLKWIPGFVLRYFQKIFHEQEINDFIDRHHDKYDVDFCEAVLTHFKINLTFSDIEKVPATGGCVLVVNHPLGGMDAMALATILRQRRTDIKFIVNDVLMNVENLKGMFVGVNKLGKNAKASLKKVDELFASEQLICLFPAGLVSRKTNGVVQDLEWKKAFITRSRKYGRPIIPAHINGELSNFFYRLANFRKRIGIKANIEMLYLVDELFSQENKSMHVVFGNTILPDTLTRPTTDQQWAQHIKEIVYNLPA